MPRELSNAEKIRDWVAENFHDVGEFHSVDVAASIEGVEIKATGNISSALLTWVEEQKIVRGFRLRRLSDKGKTAVWICEKIGRREATGASIEKPVAISHNEDKSFIGEIIDQNGNSLLVKHEGKLFKVVPFKY